jgi:adenine deaminase
MVIKGQIVDLDKKEVFSGAVEVEQGIIKAIRRLEEDQVEPSYILPGFIDAHVHIESSMLVPSEFARLAVVHGTVATVSDPHEIANVMGLEGVNFMIENGNKAPFKFYFGAPSCVPATPFETAGATLGLEEVRHLLRRPEVKYLSEMMNYPGVLHEDETVMAKIQAAKDLGLPVDGHAPGLRGKDAGRYINTGISTDHECFTYDEALEKLQLGMKIIIREGSAARNFKALIGLLPHYPDRIMFCSDDKHPDDLVKGHINQLVARAVGKGYDLFDVLSAACINPVKHYNLEVGRLRVGDPADFIEVDDLDRFWVKATYIDGRRVAAYGETLIPRTSAKKLNNFNATPKEPADFQVPAAGENIQVMQAIDGEIVTGRVTVPAKRENGVAISDTSRDILKIAVVNRYADARPAVGFIQGFNLKEGALASCVAHDSHNIVAVGVDDESICRAVNLIIQNKGGISAVTGENYKSLALPVAGIMCDHDGYALANAYGDIDSFVRKKFSCSLRAPFMTLSFMALLVIPDLKMSDQGLFDGKAFQFTDLFV